MRRLYHNAHLPHLLFGRLRQGVTNLNNFFFSHLIEEWQG